MADYGHFAANRSITEGGQMKSLCDYARSSKIGRVVVTTIGVGSFLGLVAALAIWASTSRSLFYLCVPCNENLCISIISWRGYCSAHLFKCGEQWAVATAPTKIAARMHEANHVDTTDLEQHHRRSIIRLDLSGSSEVLARIALPLWSLALSCAFMLAASIRLSFKFTVRTLLVSLTVSSLLLGALAVLLRRE